MSPETALQRIADHLHRTDFGARGWVAPPYAELEVPASTKHAWSPRLAIEACEIPLGCRLHCRFQPEPSIWTLYMAGWGVLVVLGAVCIAWAWARSIMGAGLGPPVGGCGAVVGLGIVWSLIPWIGQRLGADQIDGLRHSLETALLDRPVIRVPR